MSWEFPIQKSDIPCILKPQMFWGLTGDHRWKEHFTPELLWQVAFKPPAHWKYAAKLPSGCMYNMHIKQVTLFGTWVPHSNISWSICNCCKIQKYPKAKYFAQTFLVWNIHPVHSWLLYCHCWCCGLLL